MTSCLHIYALCVSEIDWGFPSSFSQRKRLPLLISPLHFYQFPNSQSESFCSASFPSKVSVLHVNITTFCPNFNQLLQYLHVLTPVFNNDTVSLCLSLSPCVTCSSAQFCLILPLVFMSSTVPSTFQPAIRNTHSVVPSFHPAWHHFRMLYLNTVPYFSTFFLPLSSISAAQQYLTLTEFPL